MKESEISHIIIAIIILSIVIGFRDLKALNYMGIVLAILFAFIIIILNVLGKKIMSYVLDLGVEHKIWYLSRYGFRPSQHTKGAMPIGAIIPLVITFFSLGVLKVMTILTYNTKALKRRAVGYYSYTEITDWHNALVGAAGIVVSLLLAFMGYWFSGTEFLARMSAFYAFFNMLPIGKLDGAQIYFGSRLLWYALAIITIIFAGYALLLV